MNEQLDTLSRGALVGEVLTLRKRHEDLGQGYRDACVELLHLRGENALLRGRLEAIHEEACARGGSATSADTTRQVARVVTRIANTMLAWAADPLAEDT